MTDSEVEELGQVYFDWLGEAEKLRGKVEDALDACHNGEIDPGFGRDLAAAYGVLAGVPGVAK